MNTALILIAVFLAGLWWECKTRRRIAETEPEKSPCGNLVGMDMIDRKTLVRELGSMPTYESMAEKKQGEKQ